MNKEDRDMLITILEKVHSIERSLSKPPYPTIVERVKTHGRVLWLTVGLAVASVFKAFLGTPNG